MLSRARIFLVENEPLIALELAGTIAEAHGTVTATARSCGEALELVDTADANVGILDVRLPDGKSFGIAERLARRGIPFLFCTADIGDRQQFSDWPGVPVIAKPYRPDVVVEMIARLLTRPA